MKSSIDKSSLLTRSFSYVFSLGPLAAVAIYVAIGTLGLFTLRGLVLGIGSFFKSTSRTYSAASVTATKRAFQLKPLVVFDAGICVIPQSDNEADRTIGNMKLPSQEEAILEFAYQGHADYAVDLSPQSTIVSNVIDKVSGKRIIHIWIPRPRVDDDSIKFDNASATNRWLMTWGSNPQWKEWYRNNHEKFVFGAISRTAHAKHVRIMAEEQTKSIIRNLVAPLVDDPERDIIIDWNTSDPLK